MPPVKMTRAEYEAKYGAQLQAPTSTSTPIKMTRAEYEAKYGTQPQEPNPVTSFVKDVAKEGIKSTIATPIVRTAGTIGTLFGSEKAEKLLTEGKTIKYPIVGDVTVPPVGDAKQTAGEALTGASFIYGGGQAGPVLKSVLKPTLSKMLGLAKPGAVVGGLSGAGAAMEEGKSAKEIAQETAIGATIGASVGPTLAVGVKGAAKVAEKVGEQVQKITEPAKIYTKQAKDNINKALSVQGKKSLGVALKADDKRYKAFDILHTQAPNLKVTDDFGGEMAFDPKNTNFKQFGEALSDAKKKSWDFISNQVEVATGKGLEVDGFPFLENLNKIAGNKFKPTSIRQAAANLSDEIAGMMDQNGKIPVAGLTQYNKDLNTKIGGVMTGTTDNSVRRLEADLASEISQKTDEAIEAIADPRFGTFKDEYSALKSIEKDVVRRMQQEARMTNTGFGDMISNYGNIETINGLIRAAQGDPTGLVTGIGQKALGAYLKKLREPSTYLRRAFQDIEKAKNPSQISKTIKEYTSPQTKKKVKDLLATNPKGMVDPAQIKKDIKDVFTPKKETLKGYHIARDESVIPQIEKEGFSVKSFGKESNSQGTGDPLGVYFFPDKKTPKTLEGWEDYPKHQMLERELHIEKPYTVKSKEDYFKEVVVPATKTEAKTFDEFRLNNKEGDSQKISDYLQKEGYDMIIDKEGLLSHNEPQYIVLDVNKIKKPEGYVDRSIPESKPKKMTESDKEFMNYLKENDPEEYKKRLKDFLPEEIKPYKETSNLTTKILKDLEGKSTVSKQYILDATNRGELKQVERDLIRQVLDDMKPNEPLISIPQIKSKYPKVEFGIYENTDEITLSKIVIPKAEQGGGIGTSAMNDLVKYADQSGKKIVLTPSTDYGGSSVSRLKDFYKRFGFTENSGRNKDFSTRESMVRVPQKSLTIGNLSKSSDTINVSDFAKKVKAELLPLKVKTSDVYGKSSMDKNSFQSRYENIALPDEIKGNVKNYKENIYESPVKTSAGQTHFGYTSDNYFGHTRIEDMADNKTRRVIEVQSDLYQKGNLEREPVASIGEEVIYNGKKYTVESGGKQETIIRPVSGGTIQLANAKDLIPSVDKSKLQQYSNPTAHFRMVREEIKKAAEDGKTKLQFPTGETAMKIEGLGNTNNWRIGNYEEGVPIGGRSVAPLTKDNIKVGMIVNNDEDWVVTDVLGDGKFKAVPKDNVIGWSNERELYEQLDNSRNFKEVRGNKFLEDVLDDIFDNKIEEDKLFQKYDYDKVSDELQNQYIKTIGDSYKESFDISGKIDTNNPIYRFYEKDLGRYLSSKYEAKTITDDKGVSWYEVAIDKKKHGAPVEAFGLTPLGLPSLTKEEVEEDEESKVTKKSILGIPTGLSYERKEQGKSKVYNLKDGTKVITSTTTRPDGKPVNLPPKEWRKTIEEETSKYGFSQGFLSAVLQTESNMGELGKNKTGNVGKYGYISSLTPGAYKDALKHAGIEFEDTPEGVIRATAAYLDKRRKEGQDEKSLYLDKFWANTPNSVDMSGRKIYKNEEHYNEVRKKVEENFQQNLEAYSKKEEEVKKPTKNLFKAVEDWFELPNGVKYRRGKDGEYYKQI